MRRLPGIAVALALALGGCAGADAAKDKAAPDDEAAAKPVPSLLIVDGTHRTKDRLLAEEPEIDPAVTARGPVLKALASGAPDNPWPALPLLANGTIDANTEFPFTDQPLEPQPTPMEDDPDTTLAIDTWAARLREVSVAEWNLRSNNGKNSPFSLMQDPTMSHIVRIGIQRCGGARTVATGVVVANETVVTTVHVIESTALRVRVSPALGEPAFVPAMVRYLDVDDDVAVLKVPGLKMQPIGFHTPDGTIPEWGYAYGVTTGGVGGSLRRSPAVVSMQESTIDVEQHDGFGKPIADRSVFPIVAAVGSGMSGGLVTATNGAGGDAGWELHGLVRARMPMRSLNAAIVVPARVVQQAVTASGGLPPWFEHRPGGCPQWFR